MSRDITQCGREDSNLHPRRDRDLNPARLPIPPHPRTTKPTERSEPLRFFTGANPSPVTSPRHPTVAHTVEPDGTVGRRGPGYSHRVPPATSSTPSVAPVEPQS